MKFVLKLTRPKPFVIKVSSSIRRPFAGLQLIKWEDSADRIYRIRETESTLDDSKLRQTELAKIKSAKHHFEVTGTDDYARAVPGVWEI